jgi:prevent-host-death family protein
MKTSRVSITEAKQNLGELVKRVAYGEERIALEFRGKPKAALVSWQDFQRLQKPEGHENEVLDELHEIRRKIIGRVGILPEAGEMLRQVRQKRLNELTSLR